MDSVDESGVRSIQPEKNTTLFCFIGSLHPTNTPRIFPAQRSRNQKNLTTKTRRRKEILCDSSRLRLFVVNRIRAHRKTARLRLAARCLFVSRYESAGDI